MKLQKNIVTFLGVYTDEDNNRFVGPDLDTRDRTFNRFWDDPGRGRSLKKGVCLGLSFLYLCSAFIGDCAKEKGDVSSDLDDLDWFKHNFSRLQNYVGEDERKELVRFIALIHHFQNHEIKNPHVYKLFRGRGRHIFDDARNSRMINTFTENPRRDFMTIYWSTFTRKVVTQYSHARNVEFTSGVKFDLNKKSFNAKLLDEPGPFYGILHVRCKSRWDLWFKGHAVAIYKRNDEELILYDPNIGEERYIRSQTTESNQEIDVEKEINDVLAATHKSFYIEWITVITPIEKPRVTNQMKALRNI